MMATVTPALFEGIARRQLILHFDVNRTIIQVDPAGGKSLADILNTNVADRVFGAVNRDSKTWEALADCDPAVFREPTAAEITYSDFVDSVLHPKPDQMASLSSADAGKLWKEVTDNRRMLKNAFTESGKPGAAFRSSYDRLAASMKAPDQSDYYLIPSFFQLLNTLSVLDWPFAVVFRTFGHDLPPVMEEYLRFIRGEHPVFKPQGSRLEEARKSLAASVSPKEWCPVGHVVRSAEGMDFKWAAASGDGASWRLSPRQLSDEIRRAASREGLGVPSLGLTDYYPWWASKGEHQSAGKVFPVELGPTTPFQVFFDDNIRILSPIGRSIVDLRVMRSGAANGEPEDEDPPFAEAKELQEAFLCSVDPWDALINPAFFSNEAAIRLRRQMELQ